MYYIDMVITYTQQSMNQPVKVVNLARCQLNRENELFLCPRMRLRIWYRETGSAVLSRASACSLSILRLKNLVLTYYRIPPDECGV